MLASVAVVAAIAALGLGLAWLLPGHRLPGTACTESA